MMEEKPKDAMEEKPKDAMAPGKSRFGWLAGMATALSLVVCYGTLVVIALLGALGFAITLNKTLWAGAIVTFALLAVGGLGLGLARHRKPWPIMVGGLGAAVIGYAMYGRYDRLTEFAGFALLLIAAVWDWRTGRNCRGGGQNR